MITIINPGKLNKKITFLKYGEIEDECQQTIQEFIPFKTVWACVEPVKEEEYLEAQRIGNKRMYQIYTRYFPEVSEDMIVCFKGREFKITSVMNPYEKNEMLQIACYEEVKKNEFIRT